MPATLLLAVALLASTGQAVPPPPSPLSNLSLTIHAYGGSITMGVGYVEVLAKLLPNAQVHNFGISATGVAPHLFCGLRAAPADIIVSEYRINERDVDLLRHFYDIARNFSAHTVILDLWSWLTPWTPGEFSSTIRAKPNGDHAFSVLDLATLTGPMWRLQLPPFTAGNMFADVLQRYPGSDTEACLRGATESTQKDRDAVQKCRKSPRRSEMQHGSSEYAKFVAAALASHILELVRTGNALSSRKPTSGVGGGRLCINHWGQASLKLCKQLKTNSKNSSDGRENYYRLCAQLTDFIVNTSGFQYGSVWGRSDKMTVHSNHESAAVTFDCPVREQSSYTHARLGFVVHSSESESGTIEVNGMPLSTHQPGANEGLRIQHFAHHRFELPLTIRVTKLHPGAHIEITGIEFFESK